MKRGRLSLSLSLILISILFISGCEQGMLSGFVSKQISNSDMGSEPDILEEDIEKILSKLEDTLEEFEDECLHNLGVNALMERYE